MHTQHWQCKLHEWLNQSVMKLLGHINLLPMNKQTCNSLQQHRQQKLQLFGGWWKAFNDVDPKTSTDVYLKCANKSVGACANKHNTTQPGQSGLSWMAFLSLGNYNNSWQSINQITWVKTKSSSLEKEQHVFWSIVCWHSLKVWCY